jgi:hypothetical protein
MTRPSPALFAALAMLGAPLLSSCSQDQALRRSELAKISSDHEQELAAFHQAQADFTHSNPVPRQLDFGADGTILLHACALDAPPERAQLWLRYTWVNTTDHPIDRVVVTIALKDPTGAEAKAVEMPLELPFRFRFGPDSSYTTSIDLSTDGVHLQHGWSFDIRPAAVRTGLGASRYP